MVSKVPTTMLEVHPDLEEGRPLTERQFDKLKEGEIHESDLDDDEYEFFQDIKQLSKNIQQDEQIHPCLVHSKTLVSGFKRYLAAKWGGYQLEYRPYTIKSVEDVPQLILQENENRTDLSEYSRAKQLAKSMGLWDWEEDEFLPPSEADQNATLTEIADRLGTSPSTIYKQLSPVRRNEDMQEDFGDEIAESSFRLIEEIAPTEAPQYDIAQSLVQSSISTHKEFKELVDDCKEAPGHTVENVCTALTEYEVMNETKGELDPDEAKTSAQLVHERNKQQIEQEEQREKERMKKKRQDRLDRLGQKLPESKIDSSVPQDIIDEHVDTTTKSVDMMSDDETVRIEGEYGTQMINLNDKLEDDKIPIEISIEDEEIAGVILDECSRRDTSPEEYVKRIVRKHFKKTGKLEKQTVTP